MTRKTQLFYRGRAVRLQQSWPDGTALVQFLDHGHVAVVSANEVSSVRGALPRSHRRTWSSNPALIDPNDPTQRRRE